MGMNTRTDPFPFAPMSAPLCRRRPGRRGAPAGRACREGVGLRRHNGADIGAKGNGCGSRVHAHEGSHHLVLSDADRSREASLAMKESTRQVKTASA